MKQSNSLFSIVIAKPLTVESVKDVCGEESAESIETIINAVEKLSDGAYKIKFDISLVRGQGYYTGTVFEIVSDKFKGSIAGGGRYDNLIGKFTGENIPAVGFSIGFERIFSLLTPPSKPLSVSSPITPSAPILSILSNVIHTLSS